MIFWGLVLLSAPFVLPIISLVSQSRIRARLGQLEDTIAEQSRAIDELKRRLRTLLADTREAAPATSPAAAAAPPQPVTVQPPPVARRS